MGSKELPVENIEKSDLSQASFPLRVAKALIDSFQGTGRRNPADVVFQCNDEKDKIAPVDKTTHIRLITIGVSHYCEKVRWCLDLIESDPKSPLYNTEDAHPPVFCSFITYTISNGTASMSPMIVHDDGTTQYDSIEIVQQVAPFLYPEKIEEEVLAFEEYMGKHLGPTSRCYIYHNMLQEENHQMLIDMATAHSSKIETTLFRNMLGKGLSDGMRKAMNINEESAESSLSEIRSVFKDVSDRLKDGREYLLDQGAEKFGFTAADLTFASLAGPVMMPEELSKIHPDRSALPEDLASVVEELRATPAGHHALKIYKKHRFGGLHAKQSDSAPEQKVVPKCVDRDRKPWPFG